MGFPEIISSVQLHDPIYVAGHRGLAGSAILRRLTAEGWQGSINLPKLSEEFYRSARWLRVYTSTRLHIESRRVLGLVQQSAEQVRERVALGSRLLD